MTADQHLPQARRGSPAKWWMARIAWMTGLALLVGAGAIWMSQQRPTEREKPPRKTVARTQSRNNEPAETPKQEAAPKAKASARPPEGKAPAAAAPAPPPAPQPLPLAEPVALNDARLWPELDSGKEPLRPLLETAFPDVSVLPGLPLQELRRWLEAVPGQPHRFVEDRRGNVVCSGMEGVVRLRPKWVENAILRLAPFETDNLCLHFWVGDTGVSLILHQQQPVQWSAYLTTRKGDTPRPVTWSLAATDSGRYERMAAGPVEIRYQDHALVLSRGPFRLLTVPLAEPPQEIYLDRRAWFRSFSMFLGEPIPDDAGPVSPSLLAELPASIRWQTHVGKGAAFEIRDDGTVRLAADAVAEPAWSLVRLPRVGLQEFIVQVEEMTPGTGVCLADAHGQPTWVVGFSRDQRTGWTTFSALPTGASGFESHVDVVARPAPVTHRQQWLRVICSSGCLKIWTSGDGRHWSPAAEPMRNIRGGVAFVGLICLKHAQPRSIALRSLQVRELAALADLAPRDLRDAVPHQVATHTGDLSTWLTSVIDTQPEDAEPDEWRMACAIQTLAQVPPTKLGNLILNGILEDQLSQPKPLEQRVACLRAAAELFDAWDAPECYRLVRHYEQLGLRIFRDGHPRPWTAVGKELLTAPIWTSARYSPVPESLVRSEVLGFLYQDDLQAADDVCDQLRFFGQPSQPDGPWPPHMQELRLLADWIQGAPEPSTRTRAARRGRNRVERPAVLKFRHPLIVDLSKEGFNTLGEMQSALSEGSWKEACQVISTVDLETAQGLLPDAVDSQLLVSLPQAVDVSMRDHPQLKKTMVAEYGAIARLRVQQAIVEGNPAGLEAVAIQFHGTAAAADAHRWLGDRWLAGGEFGRAAAAFQQGLTTADDAQRGELQSRLRLTAALMGRDAGLAVSEPVHFQDQVLEPARFEQLIADVLQRRLSSTGTTSLAAIEAAVPMQLPKAVRYEVSWRLPLPLETGKNPANWTRGEADWVAHQLSGQVVGDVLYLSNRFSVMAVDLVSHAVKWHTPLGGEMGEAHGWHLSRMKPIVTADRVYLRRLTKDGPELVALDVANGSVLWKKFVPDVILTDPMAVQDSLLVLTASAAQDGLLNLMLTSLAPRSGEVLAQRPLVRLIDAWSRQVPCEVTLTGGQIYCSVGGSVLCCDVTGQLLWVRRQTWLPRSHEARTWDQPATPPIIDGERIVLSQPGVMAVECLESGCGRRIWQRVLPDLIRVIAVSQGRVIVQAERRLLGLNRADGSIAWERADQPWQAGYLAAVEGKLLLVRNDRFREDVPQRPHLVWLDSATGDTLAGWPLDPLQEKRPQVGPLFVHHDRLLLLWGKHDRDVERELVVLSPTAVPALAGHSHGNALRSWVQPVADARVGQAVESLLPGWLCLGSADGPGSGWTAQVRGQVDVCGTVASSDCPVTFVRWLTVPRGRKTRLEVVAGCLPNEAWTLDIRAGGRTLETQRVEDASFPSGWADLRVDLTPYAGRTIPLVVEQQFSGKPAHAYWKRLHIVSE